MLFRSVLVGVTEDRENVGFEIEYFLQHLFDSVYEVRGSLTDADLEEVIHDINLVSEWKAWVE